MNIIIPMAGMGKRMRPHTLTTPKPLLNIAGQSIVERLIIDLANMADKVDEIAFIIGDFGEEVEEKLISIAKNLGYTSKIYYQYEALGTAHALSMAGDSLKGNTLIAYADTLFDVDFKISKTEEAYIWVKKIDNPSQFGVVVYDENGYINQFVEKPKQFVSDMAIIGIYYFREGEKLRTELDFLLERNIKGNGEYQITDALENMKNKGTKIKIAEVDAWFDCGNKDAFVSTNKEILNLGKYNTPDSSKVIVENTVIHPPCFIADHVRLINAEIGPFVSIGEHSTIENSKLENSVIFSHSHIKDSNLNHAMIGSHVSCEGIIKKSLNLGDYTEIK